MLAPANKFFGLKILTCHVGVALVVSCVENVLNLGTEQKFCDIWDEVIIHIDRPEYDMLHANVLLQDYVVQETAENNEVNKHEMQRLFCRTMDEVATKTNL